MDVNRGLRARRKRQTREALAAAARELFRHRGYEATTVEDIAAAAGVSRRTFFRYYPTKEDVLFARQAQRIAVLRRSLREGSSASVLGVLREACEAVAEVFERDREEVLVQLRVAREVPAVGALERSMDSRWEAALAEFFELRGGVTSRQARILAGAVVGTMRVVLRDWLQAGASDSLVDRCREAFDVLTQWMSGVLLAPEPAPVE